MPDTACWRVYWGNPYTQPPDGSPRELYRQEVSWGRGAEKQIPAAVEQCCSAAPAGYVVGWSVVPPRLPSARQWSPERKRRAWRARIAAKIREKYPLFVEEFLRREESRG